MNILFLLLIIPVLTIIGILFTRDNKQVRIVSAIGMTFQLITAAVIILWFLAERNAGNTAEILFASNYVW